MRFFFYALGVGLCVSSKAAVYEVSKGSSDFQQAPEYQAILGQLKLHGGFSAKSTETKVKTPPTLSRGQLLVEEAKRKNREALAQARAQEKAREEARSSMSVTEQWRDEVKATHAQWRKEIEDQRLQWKKEQDIFLGRVKEYQAATYVIPAPPEKIIERPVTREALPDAHIVSGAFTVPVRDQGPRATCAAFAGVRAVEIVLAQHKLTPDLSEQYLYWASKPTCQRAPCAERGSWITRGYEYSQARSQVDIPLEKSCGYQLKVESTNETQVPLTAGCSTGVAQVLEFTRARTLADVIEKLKQNIPIVMSARMSTNFYLNQGLVTLSEAKKSAPPKRDQHTQGHAFLAVGVIELPAELQASEGQYCLVISNSWGAGWGAGGYGCLTEKWLEAYRSDNTFVGPTKVAYQ